MMKSVFVQASAKYGAKVKSIKDHDAAMAEFANRASNQLSDYYNRRSQDNQHVMLADLNDIRAGLDSCTRINQAQMSLLKELNDKMSKMRELTPHESAMKKFEDNLKKLNASSNQPAILSAKLARRSPPQTCTWIFDLASFKTWYETPTSQLIWVSGNGGFGKSILISTIIDELQKRSSNTGAVVCFFFCNASDDATKAADRIRKHILSQIYSLLSQHSTETVEKANALITSFLKGSSAKSGEEKKGDDIDFGDACRSLAALICKPLYIVVDALDECIDNQKLVSGLRSLTTEQQVGIKVILCSRPEPDIETALDSVTRIKVEENNGPDIRINAQAELVKLPGWTTSERQLACDKIVEKAGSYFRYVEMAVQFLKKPWQRPLAKHLEQLPQGLDAFYEEAIRKTDPAYFKLLETSLTWAVLADGRVRVREIMDAYSRVYTIEEDQSEELGDRNGPPDDFEDNVDSFEDLYVQQIRIAGSSLLEVDSTSRVVQVRHNTIKDFFLKSGSLSTPSQNSNESSTLSCAHCAKSIDAETHFTLSERHGHLSIAVTICEYS